MGDIVNMQNRQNNGKGVNLSYMKNKIKPPMEKKGIKGFLTLIGPNAKNYRLKQDQRKVQLYGRTIAAIASAILIAGSTYVGSEMRESNISQNSTSLSTEFNNESLDKDTVLSNATNKLQECIYTTSSSYQNIKVEYSKNDELGYYSISFKHQYKNSFDYHEGYKYTSTNNKSNDDNINKIFNKILEIKNSENPSLEELQELENMIDNLDTKSFHLSGGSIIQNTEKELDVER